MRFGKFSLPMAIILFLAIALAILARPAPAAMTEAEKAAALSEIKAALPDGWEIVATKDAIPDRWRSYDGRSLLIEGKKPDGTFRLWAVPGDWIGIREPEKVLRDGWWFLGRHKDLKLIFDPNNRPTALAFWKNTPRDKSSLVNSGWRWSQKTFQGRFDEADRTAQKLIDEFCKTEEDRDIAVLSLVLMGVPAKNVYLKHALEGNGLGRDDAISALSLFGGKEAAAVLCKVLQDRNASEHARDVAVTCLEYTAEPESAPALLEALDDKGLRRWDVARALVRLRCTEAAPKILKLMQEEEDTSPWKASYVSSLASLGHKEAIPALRKLAKTEKFTTEWAMGEEKRPEPEYAAEGALMRLTSLWGEPARGVRLLLLPPEKPQVGKEIMLTVVVENVSDKELNILDYLTGTLIIDGQPHDVGPGIWDGPVDLDIGAAWVYVGFDVSKWVPKPGKYQLRYETGKGVSNTITLDVRP